MKKGKFPCFIGRKTIPKIKHEDVPETTLMRLRIDTFEHSGQSCGTARSSGDVTISFKGGKQKRIQWTWKSSLRHAHNQSRDWKVTPAGQQGFVHSRKANLGITRFINRVLVDHFYHKHPLPA